MKVRYSQEQKKPLREECVAYFRNQPILHRLLCGFREKYRSYGGFSGTVTLRSLKMEDIEILEGFLQKNYHGQKSVSISAERFEKALQSSRFGEITPSELLDAYFQEKIVGKKEQKLEEMQKWKFTLKMHEEMMQGTPAKEWIASMRYVLNVGYFGMESDKNSSQNPFPETLTDAMRHMSQRMLSYLKKRYYDAGNHMEPVEHILALGSKILNEFPYRKQAKEYLAVFAAMMTGDPHAFDEGSEGGWLLTELVQWELEKNKIKLEESILFPTQQKQKRYLSVGILRDDISNYGIISGIRAWKDNGNVHAGMEGFFQEGDMVQIPLSVIVDWKLVECPQQEIYIVENPSIYAMLCGKWKGKRACMCMNGQPRLSSLFLLDLLAKAGTKVYYAGDFDPEGLLIAQKLKKYYRGVFAYWHMTPEVYLESLSKKEISETSLKQLENISDDELKRIAETMKECKLAGYQENVWERYLGE